MDHKPSSLSFAAIGHQDDWNKALQFANSVRELKELKKLSLAQVKDVYKYIPPRTMFEVTMHSTNGGSRHGVYIETFISPDELDTKHIHYNLQKVKEACLYAASLNIPIVSLGGLTSIMLETTNNSFTQINKSFFTTGNTLTAAFIIEGIKKACDFWDQPLGRSKLLIVGATGDIGSACARYFSGKTKALLLCSRQPGPLKKFAEELSQVDREIKFSTSINELLLEADIIICVASSILQQCDLSLLPSHAIICDAGYPKNLEFSSEQNQKKIFWGGMGVVGSGFSFDPDYRQAIYQFPVSNITHGCLLEAIVLSMEDRAEAFSTGRGNITANAMKEILQCASTHGITTAPLFNASECYELTSQKIDI